MANKDYNFQYTPLTGRLPGNSFVKQTEQAINELAGIVNEGAAQVEVITNLANQANDNSEEALEKATEALETSGRVYITLPNLDDADDYFNSQLYYFANSYSHNLPVQDTGFLEVKTNDTKTAAEQVFVADTTGLMYMRHGVITSSEVGSETVYSVTWETWSSALASEDYVQREVNTGVDTANDYTDEQIRQHGNLPVGYEYFTFNPSIPQGSLPLFGGEYSRDTYSDLWAWVQTQTGYLKTEAEWQTLSASNNGNVPYYSSGDGSTTFRVPSLKCWVRGANGTVSEVGSYLAAGLPNITGRGWFMRGITLTDWQGSFVPVNGSNFGTTTGSNIAGSSVSFDASLSNSIYGNSATVQPPSIVGMWLVKAYGVIVDTGTIDEQQYIDDRFAAAKDYTDMEVETGVPTGCVQAFAGQNTPTGWLLCDGSAVSRTTYAKLFSVIGISYGAGDGSTTFNLPNLVDKFVEGSTTAGTVKSAGLPNITGTFSMFGGGTSSFGVSGASGAFDRAFDWTANYYQQNSTTYQTKIQVQLDASRSSSVYGNSNTVQPPALTMRYIIKY